MKIESVGRVRSIVNYDIFYGIFLRGFANICAVSNSVIYDRALLWWSAGTVVELTDASVVDIDRKGNRSMPFRFFFHPRPPSLLLRLFFSLKRKSRTSCPPMALALGHSVLSDRKKSSENLWRSSILPKMIMKTLARRGSLKGLLVARVGIFVMKWSSTKNHRSLLHFFGVGAGEEQEKQSHRYQKKVDWAAKKLILDRREKLSLGCCAIGHERKEN